MLLSLEAWDRSLITEYKEDKVMKTMSLMDLTAKLVGFNTVSSESSLLMADFICEYLEGCGFVIEKYPYQDPAGVKKVNVIARKGGQESELVFSGHMDTVPFGPGWDGSPLVLVEKDLKDVGKVFQGLGIADMKFFLAVAMKAGEAISAAELKQPFALCFTSDEEVGCVGAKKLSTAVKQQGRTIGRYVVIGEPTKCRPIYAHKGYIFLEVIIGAFKDKHGTSGDTDNACHSSDPSTTTNVVEKALGAVIEELCQFRRSLEKVTDSRFKPAFPTMNIGGNILIGRITKDEKLEKPDKVAKNIIPRGFMIEGDIRPIPGQDPEDLIKILRSNIEERIRGIKTTVPDEKFYIRVGYRNSPSYPMETSKDSVIVKVAEEISGLRTGTESFNTEGNVFNVAGSETVIWGPSNIKQAHKDNEFVLAELFKEETVEKYIRLIRRICV